jgi:hypothetical protein
MPESSHLFISQNVRYRLFASKGKTEKPDIFLLALSGCKWLSFSNYLIIRII